MTIHPRELTEWEGPACFCDVEIKMRPGSEVIALPYNFHVYPSLPALVKSPVFSDQLLCPMDTGGQQ